MLKSSLKNRAEARLILDELARHYPGAATSLVFNSPFQLFVATVLSAQTTDEQVNRITARLFEAVTSFDDLSNMDPSDLEPYLKSCGLYRQKSRFLVGAARAIVREHGGEVPDDFEALLALPGVGRKTASIVISEAFGRPALAVDTHVFRVSKRLGLADGSGPEAVEKGLKAVIPSGRWSAAHHLLIAHGRSICHARKPRCSGCFLSTLCPYAPERGEVECLSKS